MYDRYSNLAATECDHEIPSKDESLCSPSSFNVHSRLRREALSLAGDRITFLLEFVDRDDVVEDGILQSVKMAPLSEPELPSVSVSMAMHPA